MSGVRRWRICTSRSLDRAQQATFLVTLAEVVLIWGPFIPSPGLQDVEMVLGKGDDERHQNLQGGSPERVDVVV